VSRPVARVLLCFALVSAAACDKVDLLAPTQSTISLSISRTTLPPNGTAEVIATVTEQAGTAVHNGTVVRFTSSVGVLDPPEARTQGGVARTTFRAGIQSGTARVGAFSGSARATEVEIRVGGAAAETVRVRVEPATVPSTGGTVQVTALVTDASSNALPGVTVVFSSDQGTLSTNSVIADENGEARTTLRTSRQSIVRAAVGTKEGMATVSVVTLPTVSISVTPANPLVGLPVTFTVTPGSATGGNPIQNVVLDFGDGKPTANLGAISSATQVSHVYDRADTYTVTATIIDSAGLQNTNSTIVAVQRAVVSLTVSGPSTGQVGTSLTFTVTVSNTSNIPLQGIVVNFGDGRSSALGPSGGSVMKTYTTSGSFTVTATATDNLGGQYTATHSITIAPATPLDVTLDAQAADPAVTMSCVPAMGYPKTCNATFVGFGVRVQFTAGCGAGGFGGGCANAIRYEWNYGDGSPIETTTARQVDHVFVGRNTFVIVVTVFTSTGATGTQRLTLITQ